MEVIEFNCNNENKQKFEELIYFFRFCGFWVHEKNSSINDNTRLKAIRNIEESFKTNEPPKLFTYSKSDYVAKIYIYNTDEEYNNHPVADKDIIIFSGNGAIESNINKNFINYSDFIDKNEKLVEQIIDIMKIKKFISKDTELEMKILNKFYFENNVYPLLASNQRLYINKNRNINDNISRIYANGVENLRKLHKENVNMLGQISTMHIQNAFVYLLCEASRFETKFHDNYFDHYYDQYYMKLVAQITEAILQNYGIKNIYDIFWIKEKELVEIPCLSNMAYYAISDQERLYDILGTKCPPFLFSYYNQYLLMDAVIQKMKLDNELKADNWFKLYPMARKLPELFPDDYNAWLTGMKILFPFRVLARKDEFKYLNTEEYIRCFKLYIDEAIMLLNNLYNNFNMKYINDRYKIYEFYSSLLFLMNPYDENLYLPKLIDEETNFFKSLVENKLLQEPIIYVDDKYDVGSLRFDYLANICKMSHRLLVNLWEDYEDNECRSLIMNSNSEKNKILTKNNLVSTYFWES